MIRYRFAIVLAAAFSALLYLNAWRAADQAPDVLDAHAGLAVPLDDVAIYFRYAQQALHGDWLRYSPGAALSTGVTSPAYALLLTGLMGLGLPGPWAAWALGALSWLLALVAMDALGRRLFPALPPWWAPLLLLCQGAWAGWSFNGMETGLALALVLCAALASLGAELGVLLGVLAALAFTRPEGQVLAGLFGLAWAWRRRKPQALIGVVFVACAPSALLVALSGSFVPDSVRAKSVGLFVGQDGWALMGQASEHAVGLLKGLWMGLWSGQDRVGIAGDAAAMNPVAPLYPPFLLLVTVFGVLAPKAKAERPFWIALITGLGALAVLLSWQLPVGWHSHRYQAVAAPLLWLGALAALQALRAQGGLGRPLAAALFLLWAAFGLASWPWHLQHCYQSAWNYAKVNRNAALALQELPAGPVAVADAGLLAYYSGRPIVDMLGITDHPLALAQSQGKGAVLEALIARRDRPRWAVLHESRGDLDIGPYRTLGLLGQLQTLSGGMRLWFWNWHAADRQGDPLRLPAGTRVAGELNTARLDQEAASSYSATGPLALRSRMVNLQLFPGGPQVPEGGRSVLSERFQRQGEGLLLRAVFDEAGSLRVVDAEGRNLLLSAVDASPSGCYSEHYLPLPADAPEVVEVLFDGDKGQPAAWLSCHHWFVTH